MMRRTWIRRKKRPDQAVADRRVATAVSYNFYESMVCAKCAADPLQVVAKIKVKNCNINGDFDNINLQEIRMCTQVIAHGEQLELYPWPGLNQQPK